MPVHEWTRVTAGTFHDFHNAWITELRNVLNGGLLPEGYYALGEQRSGDVSPDVVTLHAETAPPEVDVRNSIRRYGYDSSRGAAAKSHLGPGSGH
jgi:hypothetical protein